MPSPLPVNPSPSSVVALMFTAVSGISSVSAMFFLICSLYGASLGSSAIIVMSTLPTLHPRASPFTLGEKLQRIGSFISVVGIGKMFSYIPESCCPEHRVHQCVRRNIRIRMTEKPELRGDRGPAEYQVSSRDKFMYVISVTDSYAQIKILRRGYFGIGTAPEHYAYINARVLCIRGIIRSDKSVLSVPSSCACSISESANTCGVCTLYTSSLGHQYSLL